MVKALLIHRAGWGSRAAFLDRHYGPHGRGKHSERRDNISRLLGYGFELRPSGEGDQAVRERCAGEARSDEQAARDCRRSGADSRRQPIRAMI